MELGLLGGFDDFASAQRQVEDAAAAVFASYWVPQPLGPDTLTCVALTSANTGSMRIGTAVVPT